MPSTALHCTAACASDDTKGLCGSYDFDASNDLVGEPEKAGLAFRVGGRFDRHHRSLFAVQIPVVEKAEALLPISALLMAHNMTHLASARSAAAHAGVPQHLLDAATVDILEGEI